MSALERLRAMCDTALPGTMVPIEALRMLLDAEGAETLPSPPAVPVDLTAEEVARLLHRKPSTIRGWLGEGKIPSAYLFQNREWRIPREALERFLVEQRKGTDHASAVTATTVRRSTPRRQKAVDLGAWRKVRAAGGGR